MLNAQKGHRYYHKNRSRETIIQTWHTHTHTSQVTVISLWLPLRVFKLAGKQVPQWMVYLYQCIYLNYTTNDQRDVATSWAIWLTLTVFQLFTPGSYSASVILYFGSINSRYIQYNFHYNDAKLGRMMKHCCLSARRPGFDSQKPFCVEFPCSLHVCVSFLQVLWCPQQLKHFLRQTQ